MNLKCDSRLSALFMPGYTISPQQYGTVSATDIIPVARHAISQSVNVTAYSWGVCGCVWGYDCRRHAQCKKKTLYISALVGCIVTTVDLYLFGAHTTPWYARSTYNTFTFLKTQTVNGPHTKS